MSVLRERDYPRASGFPIMNCTRSNVQSWTLGCVKSVLSGLLVYCCLCCVLGFCDSVQTPIYHARLLRTWLVGMLYMFTPSSVQNLQLGSGKGIRVAYALAYGKYRL